MDTDTINVTQQIVSIDFYADSSHKKWIAVKTVDLTVHNYDFDSYEYQKDDGWYIINTHTLYRYHNGNGDGDEFYDICDDGYDGGYGHYSECDIMCLLESKFRLTPGTEDGITFITHNAEEIIVNIEYTNKNGYKALVNRIEEYYKDKNLSDKHDSDIKMLTSRIDVLKEGSNLEKPPDHRKWSKNHYLVDTMVSRGDLVRKIKNKPNIDPNKKRKIDKLQIELNLLIDTPNPLEKYLFKTKNENMK